jgi:hypothetical protein
VVLAVLGGRAVFAQDKYTVQVPNGLAFSEFRGFEDWPTVAVSQTGDLIEVILANPLMIEASRATSSRDSTRITSTSCFSASATCEGLSHGCDGLRR